MSATNKVFEWIEKGACGGEPEPFDLYDKDEELAAVADDLCLGCPVIKECFKQGSNNEWGQWGGVFWDGQGRADKKANSHKTTEYLGKVEQLVNSH